MKSTAYKVFDIIKGEAQQVTVTPYGSVGTLYQGQGIEAVYVRKEREAIDPGWFSQKAVDLILLVQGRLRIELEASDEVRILKPGQLLVLQAGTKCRAYRWPRASRRATVFVAVYPKSSGDRGRGSTQRVHTTGDNASRLSTPGKRNR